MGKWYLITSESFSSSSIVEGPLWSVDNTQLLVSASDGYSGSYLQTYTDYDSVIQWIFDPVTKEERNWNELYEDPDDDPYGIDGPFPDEMDETII